MEPSVADRSLRIAALCGFVLAVLAAGLRPSVLDNTGSALPSGLQPGAQESTQTAAAATAATPVEGFRFLLEAPEHPYPARWCSGEIGYSIDEAGISATDMDPAAEVRRWANVFAEWSAASGGAYTFSYLGERTLTTNAGQELDLNVIEPHTIAITYVGADPGTPTGYQAAAVRGRTAGNAGLQVVTTGSGDEDAMMGDRGFVMIDAKDAARLAPDHLRQTLYLHESGHALGLGHAEDPTSLMNGTLSGLRAVLSPADRAGLTALARMPCG